ncbi:MAG TPA: sigma-70 family RNA polymerase sigma factor [Gemmataceae bacterium]|nr:sigma-70 family RNA polymerase sigma factor [Gemmataceae bacterium]
MATPDPLDILLTQLSVGDAEAAQRVFETYEPYLRVVVRRHLTPALRAKFDSMDIVQSVWADLLTGFRSNSWRFANPAQLRAFLVRVTRNRLIDRVRQQQMSLRLEQRLGIDDLHELPQARPPQVADQLEADEMWQRLLVLCPPRHRDLLELKRQGLSLAEIAARTGLHEGSIRRILYALASRLAEGDR